MAGVTFQGVSKIYPDGTRAVNDLNLGIEDGEFLVLVGPSGCGKTTALRMVAGLEEISEGQLKIGDRVVNHVPSRDRDIAMVFQSYALYPHLSVYDNIGFSLKLKKIDKKEIDRRVKEAARAARPRAVSRAQAAGALGRPAAARRHGPRDRARAGGVPDGRAALQPRREAARADARRDQEAPGRSRHDDDLRHARPGRGDDDGRPRRRDAQGRAAAGRRAAGALRPAREPLRRRLHRQPGDEPVEAKLERADGGLAVGGRQPADRPRRGEARQPARRSKDYEGRDVILGIRPEDLEDAELEPDRGQTIDGTVELTEALGSEIVAHFSIDAPPAITDEVRELQEDAGTTEGLGTPAQEQGGRSIMVGRFGARSKASKGEPVRVAVDTRALHFFDPETGLGIYDGTEREGARG